MGAWTKDNLLLLEKQEQTDKQNKGGGDVGRDLNAEGQSMEGHGKEEKVLKKSLWCTLLVALTFFPDTFLKAAWSFIIRSEDILCTRSILNRTD